MKTYFVSYISFYGTTIGAGSAIIHSDKSGECLVDDLNRKLKGLKSEATMMNFIELKETKA